MNIEAIMTDIEEHAGDCKIEIHKIVPLDQGQQIKIALAFETLLDRIEDAIRDGVGTDTK